MTDRLMTCDSVDELLPEILEGDVSAETRSAVEAHVSSCARCTTLLREIEDVREGAAALPDLAPSADLWKGISARIETPVVSLGEKSRSRFAAPVWIAAAASLLIVASSGITYWVTTRSVGPESAVRTVASVPAVVVAKGEDASLTAPASESGSAGDVRGEAPKFVSPGNAVSGARLVSNTRRSVFAPDTVFASEINRLQRVLAERRGDLDPQTVSIVEMNLKLIDSAIKSSRAALAKDPASGFLNQQLSRALDKKVELLRMAALMPSST